MKTVREMFVSLTTMLINHDWASIIEIYVEKWRTQSLKKIEIQMSRHEKRYRSEEMPPTYVADFNSCAHQPLFYLCRVTFISTTYSVRFESSNNNFCLET